MAFRSAANDTRFQFTEGHGGPSLQFSGDLPPNSNSRTDMVPPTLTGNRQTTCDEPLPCFGRWRERLIVAEQGNGWLDACDDAGRFQAVSRELVDALSETLRRLAGRSPVLEVCAGAGELACQLAASGVRVQAVDAEPPDGSHVLRMSARAALRRFQPAVVLGAFVPIDAGVDEAVLACPTVMHYVVLNARIGGSLGSSSLWRTTNWKPERLAGISRWMLTRHDVWLGDRGEETRRMLQHGEAWHFARIASG